MMERMMEISLIQIRCIKCGAPLQLKIDQFDKGQFVICKKVYCGAKFNLYGVYLSFYNSIPIAKEIVDAFASEIGTNYLVEALVDSDKEKIENFLNENRFQQLLRDIVFDTVIFGNSFIEKKLQGEKVVLQRINPETFTVKTSWRKGKGNAFIEGIEKLIQHLPKSREISKEDIIHFSSIHDPLGLSVYGLWFHIWYLLKYGRKYIDMGVGLWSSKLKSARSKVIAGSGVPLFKIDHTIKVHEFFQINAMTDFEWNVQRYRERIASIIEREIFPLALGRPFAFEDYPRFKFLLPTALLESHDGMIENERHPTRQKIAET